jgi:hypothetical protein
MAPIYGTKRRIIASMPHSGALGTPISQSPAPITRQPGKVAKRGRAVLKANARRFAANVRPIIEEIMRAGSTSHNAIAAKLNERNVRTARGGTWTHVQVGAILRPFEASAGFAVP